jgi:flagellar hook assembly protein FlgD
MRTTLIALGASLLLVPASAAVATPSAGASARLSVQIGVVGAGSTAAVTVDGWHVFSPNGDHRKDSARFALKLTRRAKVTVTVIRRNLARTVVVRDRLGYLRAGTHAWTWGGRKDNGRRAGDGYFNVVVTAKVAGSDVVRKARTWTQIDTVYVAGKVVANGTTLYPHTTVVHDQAWFGNATNDTRMATGSLVVTDDVGREVFRDTQRFWPRQEAKYHLVVAWDGRNQQGRVVRAGHYWVRIVGTDKAGNTGRTPRYGVDVSATPLIEATASVTVTPKSTRQGPEGVGPCDYRGPQDCGIWKPCGEVVDSTTFTEPGSLSYRSSSTCPDSWNPHIAVGSHVLALDPAAMPRGVRTVEVSMVGGPTTAGEPDQGYLWGQWSSQSTASGPDTSVHETSTGTATSLLPPNAQPVTQATWHVETRGDDAYDVKSFTVAYTYLTPNS